MQLAGLIHSGSYAFGDGWLPCPLIAQLIERYRFVSDSHVRWSVYARIPCLRPIGGDLQRYLPTEGRILDLGCGYGLTLHLVRSLRSLPLWGIELDERRRQIALASLVQETSVRLVQGDFLSAEWPSASALLLIDVLFLISPRDKRELLHRASETLIPGGLLFIKDTAPIPAWKFRYTQWEETRKLQHAAYGRTEHTLHYFTPGELDALAVEMGFDRVAVRLISARVPYPGVIYIYRRR